MEGTEISHRHQGSPCIFGVLRVSVVNKALEFFSSLGFPQLVGLVMALRRVFSIAV